MKIFYPNNAILHDLVSRNKFDRNIDGIDQVDNEFKGYPAHFTSTQLNFGLKNGSLFQGSLSISSHNYLEGSIFTRIVV